MKAYVREQATYCGKDKKSAKYAELDYYPITESEKKSSIRAKRQQVTEFAQAKRNAENARRWLVQVANANFRQNDYTGVLCYDEERFPVDEEAAARDWEHYIRRVRAACKRRALPMPKYICVTEHQDSDEEQDVKAVRYHHHVLIACGLSRDELEVLWGQGIATGFKWLRFDKESIEGMASYILKYPNRKHRYHTSRGLVKPFRPRPNDGVMTRGKLDKMMRDGRMYDKEWWHKHLKKRWGDGWSVSEVVVRHLEGCDVQSGEAGQQAVRGGGEEGFRVYLKLYRRDGD